MPRAIGTDGELQYTAQDLGSSLGAALMGSILIIARASAITNKINEDP